MYSIFWGLLSIYLMKSLNPKIDKIINFIKTKINIKFLKILLYLIMIFLIFDCIISAYTTNAFLVKVSVEFNLPVQNKEKTKNEYYKIYGNKIESQIINKYFNHNKMLLVYPNLTLTLEDGSYVLVKTYYPNTRIYYYKFKKNVKKIIQ